MNKPAHRRHPTIVSQARVVTILAILALPATLLVLCLPRLTWRRRLARKAARFVLRGSGVNIQVRGLGRLPEGPCIVVANHASYLDGVILTAALPPRFTFVIKSEMRDVPVIGLLLRRLDSAFIARFDRRAASGDLGRMIRAARAGQALGIFPEGTFKAEPGLREFRMGAFMAAVRGGLPVVPIAINGSRRLLPAGRWRLGRGGIDIVIAAPVPPVAPRPGSARLLRDRVREIILAHCEEPDVTAAAGLAPAGRITQIGIGGGP